MKRVAILVVVAFASCAVLACAANAAGDASSKKSGWQAVYDNITDWGWEKSTASGKSKAQPKEKAPAPKKEGAKEKGTELSIK